MARKGSSPCGPSFGDSESFSVRKIDNGFIARRSGVDKSGHYREHEVFSPTKPTVVIDAKPAPKGGARASSSRSPFAGATAVLGTKPKSKR